MSGRTRRHRVVACSALCAGAVLLAGCDLPGSPRSPILALAPPTHALTGTVRSPVGEPIPGATVTYTSGRHPTILTVVNTNGFYRIEGLQSGTVSVAIGASGYAVVSRSVRLTADVVFDVTLDPLPISTPPTSPQVAEKAAT